MSLKKSGGLGSRRIGARVHITRAPIRSVSVPRLTPSWACKHATHSRINLFASAGAGLLPDENSCGIGNLNFLKNFFNRGKLCFLQYGATLFCLLRKTATVFNSIFIYLFVYLFIHSHEDRSRLSRLVFNVTSSVGIKVKFGIFVRN